MYHSHRLPHLPERPGKPMFVQNQRPPRAYFLDAEPGSYAVTGLSASLSPQSTAAL